LNIWQLNCTLSLDNYIADGLKPLAPHKSVFGMDKPREVSKNLSMPKTVVSTISNFIRSEEYVDPAKLKRMESLYVK